MEYLNINYEKLKNIPQGSYTKVIILIIIMFIILVVLAFYYKIDKKITTYGYIENGLLSIKINTKLSDIIKDNKELTFNNHKINYHIYNFGTYDILDNDIYQNINLIIDDLVYEGEVGKVEISYDKQKIIEYILELFK